MIGRIFTELGPWTWWVVGLVLLGLEILAPGAFLIWFGIAAILVGSAALLFDIPWQGQAILFAVLAVIVVLIGRRVYARAAAPGETTGLNERGRRLIGTEAVLYEPILDGYGRIRIDDTTWRVVGPDLPSGSRVRVVGAEGTVLRVAAIGDRQPAVG